MTGIIMAEKCSDRSLIINIGLVASCWFISLHPSKTSQLILYREIIVVCSEIHTKYINTLCGQNMKFVNVKPSGTNSNHWALKGANVYANSLQTFHVVV